MHQFYKITEWLSFGEFVGITATFLFLLNIQINRCSFVTSYCDCCKVVIQYVYRGFLQTRDTPAVKKLLSRNFAGDGRVEAGYLVRVPRCSMCPPRTFDLIANFNATVSSNFLPPRSAGEFCWQTCISFYYQFIYDDRRKYSSRVFPKHNLNLHVF